MTGQGLSGTFEEYSNWRLRVRDAIKRFRDTTKSQDLSNAQTDLRLDQIIASLDDDRLYIAFVAEFSRGKSELINAIFFSMLGRRILPSNAGRTTMCPVELMYDPSIEPCIRLLPIDTRATGTSIQEYKQQPQEWNTYPLDVESPDQVIEALNHVTDTDVVLPRSAQDLDLHIALDEAHEDGLHINGEGLVEIPRWRHAIINFPHPMLENGLVILDTPGLNALGAEPELTLNMLSSAHGVMFILAADAGVTKSDLRVWHDHINHGSDGTPQKGRIVVLNKIDVLWDELSPENAINDEIASQCGLTATTLNLPADRVFPVSAQKGLVAKINDNEELLNRSRLPVLERALSDMLIPAKQEIVAESVRHDMDELENVVGSLIQQRLAGVDEHISELESLSNKNTEVIEHMLEKVKADKTNLERNLLRFQATRSIFTRQTVQLYRHLDPKVIEATIASTRRNMKISFTSRGIKAAMQKFFGAVYDSLDQAAEQSNEIKELMQGVYHKFQEEHGLVNIHPGGFSTRKYRRDIKALENSSERFIRTTSLVMLDQGVLTSRFFDSISARIRQIFQLANKDVDNWLKTIMSPMESQIREHQIQLRRRLESIKRIHKATDTLDDRLAELKFVRDGVLEQKTRINDLRSELFHILDGSEDTGQQVQESA